MNSLFKISSTMFLLCFMTGCWDSLDLERMYYANALVIDYNDEMYEVYAQVVNFQAMASGAEGSNSGNGPIAYIGYGKGPTLVDALHNLYGHTQRRLYWGHTSAIVFTESALKQGVEKVIDTFRYHQFRHTLWFFGTTSSPKKILSAFPIVELSVIQSYLGEPEERFQQSSFVQPKRLHRFFSEIYEQGRTFVFPIINISNYWYDEEKTYDSLYIEGAGFLQNFHYKGMLLGQDIKGYRWLNEKTIRSPLVLQDHGTVVLDKPKVDITPNINGSSVTFDIKISLIVDVIELTNNIQETELFEMVQKEVEKQIRETYNKAIEKNIDVYNFSNKLYKLDPNLWKQFIHNDILPLSKDSLGKIEINIRSLKLEKNNLQPPQEKNVPRNILFQ